MKRACRMSHLKTLPTENSTELLKRSRRDLIRKPSKVILYIVFFIGEQLFLPHSMTNVPIVHVCEDSKDKVLDCYHSNPGRPLNCTEEAKEFFQCVEKARQVKGRHINVAFIMYIRMRPSAENSTDKLHPVKLPIGLFMQWHHHYNITTI